MTTHPDDERRLDEHLRRTLAAVAATVVEEATPVAAPAPPRTRRRRRLLIGGGVALAAVPLAAAAVVGLGPEYVDRIPPPDPILSGTLDGERYWVVDGRDIPRCEGLPSGVELIAEENNLVGREWNTVGYVFGDPGPDGCAPRRGSHPPEDTYYSDGGSRVGDGMLWMGALHPDVDQVRARFGDGKAFTVETFEHERGSYYTLEVPPGTSMFTIEYLVDGDVLLPPPGERAEHVLPPG
jgi:hypothetical protein